MRRALLIVLLCALSAVPSAAQTFEDVLAAPDDVELNIRFARRQIKEGDLKGAAATLERVLSLDPRPARLRLLYALVLFRLDNLPEAERELRALAESQAEDVVTEALATLRALERRRRRLRFEGGLSFGFEYSLNRNASPSSGQRLFLDLPVTVAGTARRRDDTAMLFLADVGAVYEIPSAAGHEAFAALSYLRSEQTLLDNLDLQAYAARAGATLKLPALRLVPHVAFDHIRLSEETFLRTQGGGLRAEGRLTARAHGFVEVRSAHQDFSNTSDVPLAKDRTGNQTDGSIGARWSLGPKMQLAATYQHLEKDARRRYYAFGRESFNVAHTTLLGAGRFVLFSATANYDRYKEIDRAISAEERRDDTYRLRATFGTPLGFLHKQLEPLLLTAGAEYFHAVSTITNYAYDDGKFTLLASWRWSP